MKYILFDLDGTLLPMDQDIFTKAYFQALCATMQPHGYEPQELIRAIWHGMKAMTENDGSRSNEQAFWDSFQQDFGQKAQNDKPIFDQFYRTDFHHAKKVCGFDPLAKETVALVKSLGMTPVVATLPVFPAAAIQARLGWAGLSKDDFAFYTSYENCTFTKPNPGYYRELLQKLRCPAEECLMVGNNVDEDMVAGETGMKLFLLTNCLINDQHKDTGCYQQGGFQALCEYLKSLC